MIDEDLKPLDYPDRKDFMLLIASQRSPAIPDDYGIFRACYDRLEGLDKRGRAIVAAQLRAALEAAIQITRGDK